MSVDDPKVSKFLKTIREDTEKRIEDRRKDKWPDYRETDSAARKREIMVNRHRRMAMRWATIWLPPDSDQALRQVEKLVEAYIERALSQDGEDEVVHRRTVQGLVNLGNALAKVLRAAQGGNRAARLEAIDVVARKIADGASTVDILAAAEQARPPSQGDENDPQNVMD